MALLYYVGGTPISEEEAKEKLYSGELEKLDRAVESGNSFNLDFENGQIKAEEFDIGEFTPIGVGKPLSVEILTYYTGKAPKKFLGKKDLLLTTGVKSIATHSAAPKAINQIVRKIEDNTHYEPNAFNEGSPIVYYTPALDMSTILCSFQLVADTFNEDTFKKIGSFLTNVGSIPIFAPASTILLAGGIVSNMVGKLGKAIFESKPFFRGDFDIRLDSPGQIITKARHIAITDQRYIDEFKGYSPEIVNLGGDNSEVRLVNKSNNQPYSGDAPYLLISIDGKDRPELKSFTSTIASAAILEQFYGVEDSQGQTIEVIQDALELYNDYSYLTKAENLKKRLQGIDENSEAYKSGKILFDAYNKNIQSKDLFKVSL
ncbi:hypothetical protein ATE84_2863 [Aquimarina sp. MAR_2010_214]|uniref:hypothetical protein n=1 Tax=Aquimarina sp. MAR_2010_214 TaxID=1250026 RepID=UPI000C709C5C|nr:hypothetical protein [Aquimarina sp. MAR_2010_214]PKV50796.1 hypothetical protein ATE84_2863 [Aquimarina sp. MAR_2010_214]